MQEIHEAYGPHKDIVCPHGHGRVSCEDVIASSCVDGQEDEEQHIGNQDNLNKTARCMLSSNQSYHVRMPLLSIWSQSCLQNSPVEIIDIPLTEALSREERQMKHKQRGISKHSE